MAFAPQQAKLFAKEIRKVWGDGWRFFTPEIRDAIVDSAVFSIIRAQVSESVRIDVMDSLLAAVRHEMGLDVDEPSKVEGDEA